MIVTNIHSYPIKSLSAVDSKQAIIMERGLQNDRRYMIVDSNGDFLTQRELSILATLTVKPVENGFEVERGENKKIHIAAEFSKVEKVSVRVWNSKCAALVGNEGVNSWFSDILGRQCRIVQMPTETRRPINPLFNIDDDIVSFADGYPILLTSKSSIDDLNGKMESPIPMSRFRPNIVVSGFEAFAEDKWKRIRIGKTIFRITKPCARCIITTIDQKTGNVTGKEPLKTLATYRKAKQVYPGQFSNLGLGENDVLFGQNLVAENYGETINVGDSVRLIG